MRFKAIIKRMQFNWLRFKANALMRALLMRIHGKEIGSFLYEIEISCQRTGSYNSAIKLLNDELLRTPANQGEIKKFLMHQINTFKIKEKGRKVFLENLKGLGNSKIKL